MSNMIPCACGCGELIAPFDKWWQRPRKYKYGHQNKGPNAHNWTGGRWKDIKGYVLVYATEHPSAHLRYVKEHRLVMEKHLGRYLWPWEDVHHINRNKQDNRIENLQLISHADHTKLESTKRWQNGQLRDKMIDSIIKSWTNERRQTLGER